FGERVTGAADGEDERRIGRVVLELFAQVADVHVDRLLVLVERLVVADQLEQLAATENAARLACEMAQDLELRRGQAEPAVTTLDAAALEVDEQVVVADHASAGRVG